MDKIDNIKSLWEQIEDTNFMLMEIAKVVSRSPLTLMNHWFSRFWNIPAEYQDTVISMLQKKIALQNQSKIEVVDPIEVKE